MPPALVMLEKEWQVETFSMFIRDQLEATLTVSMAALPRLQATRGAIVNLASCTATSAAQIASLWRQQGRSPAADEIHGDCMGTGGVRVKCCGARVHRNAAIAQAPHRRLSFGADYCSHADGALGSASRSGSVIAFLLSPARASSPGRSCRWTAAIVRLTRWSAFGLRCTEL